MSSLKSLLKGNAHSPITPVKILTSDSVQLRGTLFRSKAAGIEGGTSPKHKGTIVVSSATAVPQTYYAPFAQYVADNHGYHVLTYDVRGIGESRPANGSLKGFRASVTDWALLDMPAAVQWALHGEDPGSDDSGMLYLVGHSLGGQIAGMLPKDLSSRVDAMATLSSQSGYWNLQGGEQRYAVFFHMHVTLPLLVKLFGYIPWSRMTSNAQDLPGGAAMEWSKWCRSPGYLLDDPSLPLERYRDFTCPVLAYSIDDDKWGTARAVDSFMLSAYPNVTREHIYPRKAGLDQLGHFGFFREKAAPIWKNPIEWMEQMTSDSVPNS